MNRYRFWLRERLADYRGWIEGRDQVRFEFVLLACLIVGMTAIIASAYLPSLSGFAVGRPAPHSVVAGKSITALDIEATATLRQEVAELVEPVYSADLNALPAAMTELERFIDDAAEIRSQVTGPESIEELLPSLRRIAPTRASTETLRYLLAIDDPTFEQLINQSRGALRTVFAEQITERTIETARANLRSISNALALSPELAEALYDVTSGFVRPNQMVDEDQTAARREAAANQVQPVVLRVLEGEPVLQEGQVVTGQHMLILQALGEQTRSGWKIWVAIALFVILETTLFSRLLHRFNKTAGLDNNMLLALVALMLGATAVARGLVVQPLSPYLIPVSAIGMTVAIILNARSATLLVALTSVNIGILTDFDMGYAITAFLVGCLSLYLVSRVAQRAALLGAGFATMLLGALTVFAAELFKDASVGDALQSSLWGLLNGMLAGVLTIVLLVILDTVFNLTTPLRLLELANPAHPLLKRLLQVAPGSYNHSILMGNLAEAAAEAIGADPLLARVGAYYHDIGKTVRPEYFVENQIYVDNPHDRLSPNLSKLAITAHVRDGEHLAKLYGLPAPVVEIIRQHHGTSVLSYFYHKALETSKDPVEEESYRYEEQKPRSKEAAIVMLADSVEAAVKAMPNPTRRKIQGLIQEIIKQKIQDGQLDDSALTQSDLHKIRESFDTSLRGLVGHRIRYPEGNGQQEPRVARPSGGGQPQAPPPSAVTLRTRSSRGPGSSRPTDQGRG